MRLRRWRKTSKAEDDEDASNSCGDRAMVPEFGEQDWYLLKIRDGIQSLLSLSESFGHAGLSLPKNHCSTASQTRRHARGACR